MVFGIEHEFDVFPFTYRRTLSSVKSSVELPPFGAVWSKLIRNPAPTVTGPRLIWARDSGAIRSNPTIRANECIFLLSNFLVTIPHIPVATRHPFKRLGEPDRYLANLKIVN